VTPVLAHGRFQIQGFHEPITVSGQIDRVAIKPGDFIVADDDGIVAVPSELLDEALEFAEYAERIEKEIRAAIESGEDRESIDNRLDRWALLRSRHAP
jgi:regulator of RNase E activity RraA